MQDRGLMYYPNTAICNICKDALHTQTLLKILTLGAGHTENKPCSVACFHESCKLCHYQSLYHAQLLGLLVKIWSKHSAASCTHVCRRNSCQVFLTSCLLKNQPQHTGLCPFHVCFAVWLPKVAACPGYQLQLAAI